jgi:RNase P protein component
MFDTTLHSQDNAAARRRIHRRITDTLRKPTKLAKECDLVL